MSSESVPKLAWGHININVSKLDEAIGFYQKLGFELLLPSIPYLGLSIEAGAKPIAESEARALGLGEEVTGRACIMQLGEGYPKLDLTELSVADQRQPLANSDLGIVRLCLASTNLDEDYTRLRENGVRFISAPASCRNGLARIAVCADPDGALIELIEIDREKWVATIAASS